MANNEFGGIEFCPAKHARISQDEHFRKERFAFETRRHGIYSRPASESNPLVFQVQHHQAQKDRASSKTRNQVNWSNGGPGNGMQAIFLGFTNKRPCGTGVFLPRTEGTDFQSSNKPALSPVLLPARIVQTLNLKVHELGQQSFKPEPAADQPKNSSKKSEEKFEKNTKLDDIYRSPEIFLPKEWTY